MKISVKIASRRRLEASRGVSWRLVASRLVSSGRLVASRGVSGRLGAKGSASPRPGGIHPVDKGESTLETPPNISYRVRCVLQVRLVSSLSCAVLSPRLASLSRFVLCVVFASPSVTSIADIGSISASISSFFGPKSRRGFVHFRSKIASRRALGHLGASLRHVGVARGQQHPFGVSHLVSKKPPGESSGGPWDAPWTLFESLGAPCSRKKYGKL